MKYVLLLLALLVIPSCTVLKDSGTSLCVAETSVSEMVDKAGAWAGLAGAGPLIADVLTAGLGLFCGVTNAALSAPNAVGDALGVESPASSRVETPDPDSL